VNDVISFGNFRSHLPEESSIFNWVPDQSRIEAVLEYVGKNHSHLENLSTYDKFIYENRDKWEIFRIHLKYILLEEQSKEYIDTFKNCHRIEKVIRETLEYVPFHKFVEIVLAVGNTLNQENAKAFLLDALFDLDNVTSTTGNSNILQYCKNLFKELYPGSTILPPCNEPHVTHPGWEWIDAKYKINEFVLRLNSLKKLNDHDINNKLEGLGLQISKVDDTEFMKLFSKYFSDKSSKHIYEVYELMIGVNNKLVI